MLKIIDVSQWQGVINWSAVNADGAILRVGYGSDDPSQDDKQYLYNVSECKRLKIPTEGYIYSYAHNETMARSEAAHAIRLIKGTQIKRIWYDLEEGGYGTYAKTCLKAFSDAVKAAGYEVGLYTYESYYNSYLKGVTEWPIWIAKYSSYKPNIGTEYIGWQYSSGASVPGISGRVDISYWYGEFAANKQITPPKANYDVFRLYLNGEHLYTIDRTEKERLVKEGWVFEGVGWKSTKNGNPVYRYVKGDSHIWTKDPAERAALLSDGWIKEGLAFRSNVKKTVPIYRLYNKDLNSHLWTKSKTELKALVKSGWTDEGIAFYGKR